MSCLAAVFASLCVMFMPGGTNGCTDLVLTSSISGRNACPSEEVIFTCTAQGDALFWRNEAFGERPMHYTSALSRGEEFTAEIVSYDRNQNCLVSSLSFRATASRNGTTVTCTSRDRSSSQSLSLHIVSSPPSTVPTLSCVDFSETVSGAVNVTVSWTLSGGDSADFYLINITTNAPQTPYGGLLTITTASVTQHELTGFMADYEYNITVRGVNCGSLVGSESEPLIIAPQGPPSVPTLFCVGLSEDVSGAMNVTVNWTLSGGDSADFYLINITTNAPQTPYGGLITASSTQYELTCFTAGYEYNITVRGVNCVSQEGRESEPLTIAPQGPPSVPSLSCVDLSGDVSGAVNVTVNWTLSGGGSADFYLISITTNAPQIPYGGVLNITTAGVTQHKLIGFIANYEYNITVHGMTANCGGLVGRESEPLTITPQVPAVPRSGNITLSYNQSSGRLLFINSSWDTVPHPVDPGKACPGPTGDITQYQISFQTGSVVDTECVNIAKCTAGRCSYTFEPPSNPPSSYDSVSVAAENVVGVGAARKLTIQPIYACNNLLTGELVDLNSSSNVKLICTFLFGFNGSARCTAQYGTDPTYMNLPYSAESTETGTAGDTVSVVLRERLNSSTVYYYTMSAVSGDVTVRVQGTFITPHYNTYVSSSNAGAIVGGTVGGLAAVAIVTAVAIGGVVVLKKSRMKSYKNLRSEKTKNKNHNEREEFNNVTLAPLPELEEKRVPRGSQYIDVEAVHRNPNPPPILDDRVQYSDVLPQKTHVTFVLNDEPMPPPLPNKACHVRPLTMETLFTKLYPTMTPRWMKLGELLGIDEDLLDEIYVNNETDEECLRVLLEVWLQKSTNPTWKNVTDALAKIDKLLEVSTQEEEDKSELSKSGGSTSRKATEPEDCHHAIPGPKVSSNFVAPGEESSREGGEVKVIKECMTEVTTDNGI